MRILSSEKMKNHIGNVEKLMKTVVEHFISKQNVNKVEYNVWFCRIT